MRKPQKQGLQKVTVVTIVGAGRFGRYFASQIDRLSTFPLPCRYRIHLITEGQFDSITQHAFAESDIVLFAVPIRDLKQALKERRKSIPPAAIVADVCSVKMYPCLLLKKLMGKTHPNLVGLHPLFGPQSAPHSCDGQRIAVCGKTQRGKYAKLDQLIAQLGLHRINCTPRMHDQQMASQVMDHFIGRSAAHLDRVVLSTKTHELFMDIVDIVMGNSEELFHDMNVYNPYAQRARETFLEKAHRLDNFLKAREIYHRHNDGYISL